MTNLMRRNLGVGWHRSDKWLACEIEELNSVVQQQAKGDLRSKSFFMTQFSHSEHVLDYLVTFLGLRGFKQCQNYISKAIPLNNKKNNYILTDKSFFMTLLSSDNSLWACQIVFYEFVVFNRQLDSGPEQALKGSFKCLTWQSWNRPMSNPPWPPVNPKLIP